MKSHYQLAPSVTISDCPSEVFCVRFSPDGKLLATGCGDGAVRVFNVTSGKNVYNLNVGSTTGMPTTGIRFRPVTPATKTKNVLLGVNAEGSVRHMHITSGKQLHEIVDEENQLFAVDYRQDGAMFATAGKDKIVRVYDEATKTLITSMGGGYSANGSANTAGHSNRVFSLKFSPVDENILVSGGWDNTVQVWDLRAEHAVKSLFGPHICGDAMDIKGDTIVTGSWRPENTLETWDMRTGKLIENIEWNHSTFSNQEPCMLYAAQFSKDISGKFIAAGGSGANEAKVFDRTKNNAIVGSITGLSRGVFTLDFSPDGSKLAVAGGDAAIRIIDILADDEATDEVVHGGSGNIFGS